MNLILFPNKLIDFKKWEHLLQLIVWLLDQQPSEMEKMVQKPENDHQQKDFQGLIGSNPRLIQNTKVI